MEQQLMLIRPNCCEECCGSAPRRPARLPLSLRLRTLDVIERSWSPFIMPAAGGAGSGIWTGQSGERDAAARPACRFLLPAA